MRYRLPNRLTQSVAMVMTVCLMSAGAVAAGKSPKPTDKHYEHAIELIAEGDHKGGIIELKTALEKDPSDLAARVLLGNTYLEIEDGASAAEQFLQARKGGAQDSFIMAPLGRAYVLQGRYEDALTELSKVQKNHTIAAEVAAIRGEAHLALKHYGQAEKSFLDALKIRPKYVKALNGLIRVELATNDLAGAADYVDRALDAKPGNSFAWFAKGEIYRRQHKPDEALPHYDKAIELAQSYVPPRLARARILIDRDRHKDAETDIRVIRKVDAPNPHAAFLHALILASENKILEAQDALADAETILKNSPDLVASPFPPTIFMQGVVAYFRKDYTDAYRHLTAYLKRYPQHLGALKLLASLALSNGDSEYALHLLEQLAPREPGDIEILTMYGDSLMRARRHREAVQILEKAAAIAKPGYSALSRLVMLRRTVGQNADARKTLKAEMRRDPQAVQATLLMAATQLNQREFTLSLGTIKFVTEHDPKNPVAHNLAGGAYVGLNNFDAARDSFRAAFEAAPRYLLAVSNLAKLEFRLGNLSAAESLYAYMVEQDNRNGGAMIALADIHIMRDELNSAVRWLKKARENSRTQSRAALQLVDLYIYANKSDKALSVARELNGLDPANLDFLTALGRSRLAAKRSALAALTFQEVAVRASDRHSVDWLVRNVVWQMRALDERGARQSLQKALELDSKNLSAHLAFFKLEMAADKIDAALKRADMIAAIDPKTGLAAMLRGDAYMRLEKFEPALQAYENALKQNPGYRQATRVYRARRAAGHGAMAFAKSWAGRQPADRAAQRLLAKAYDDAGRDSDAVAVYETLLQAAPKDTHLLTSMAIRYQKNNPSRALELAERAFRVAPAEPAVMDTYGWILVQQGSLDEGLTLLRKAKLRAPAMLEIRYHMAVALNKMGKQDDAQQELRAALQTGQYFAGAGDARHLMGALATPQ